MTLAEILDRQGVTFHLVAAISTDPGQVSLHVARENASLRLNPTPLGMTNLFQDRPYRFSSGGAALPNGWELLFGEAISGESPPRAPQSQEENGSCFGSETDVPRLH